MTSPLTPERKQEIRERIEKAVIGPFGRRDLRDLYESHEALVEALEKLWKQMPKIDSGYCAVCRVGYALFEKTNTANPVPGPCSNNRCLSHVVRAALRNAGVQP